MKKQIAISFQLGKNKGKDKTQKTVLQHNSTIDKKKRITI